MKDNKVERIRQKIVMLKRQFLQEGTGAFDQALSDQEVAAVVSEHGRTRALPRIHHDARGRSEWTHSGDDVA